MKFIITIIIAVMITSQAVTAPLKASKGWSVKTTKHLHSSGLPIYGKSGRITERQGNVTISRPLTPMGTPNYVAPYTRTERR